MSTPVNRAWRQTNSVMLAAGILLLICVPQVQAGCGGHDFYVPSRDADAFKNTAPESANWASQAVHYVNAIWNRLYVSLPTFRCGTCPQDPTSPGNRCEGPFCSGGSMP